MIMEVHVVLKQMQRLSLISTACLLWMYTMSLNTYWMHYNISIVLSTHRLNKKNLRMHTFFVDNKTALLCLHPEGLSYIQYTYTCHSMSNDQIYSIRVSIAVDHSKTNLFGNVVHRQFYRLNVMPDREPWHFIQGWLIGW